MTDQSRTSMKRVVGASVIGTSIEWYDFFLYGSAAALVFNKLFFPEADPVVGTMLAFLTYAVGFVARPLGGIVFGHFGDRIGRKTLLMLSLLMMGGSTFAIGLIPTYATLGSAAAILLVLLRFIQGIAVGGEWGGAVLLVAEHSRGRNRGLWASTPQAGAPIGNLLATAVLWILSFTLSEQDFLAWGWRVAFLLSAALIVTGYWMRRSVEDAAVFKRSQAEAASHQSARPAPLREVLRHNYREVACGMAARLVENISYYLITAFTLAYAADQLGLEKGVVLSGLIFANVAHLIAIPFFGGLSDRLGRKTVYLAGAILMGAYGFVFFPLLDTKSTALIAIALVLGLILHAMMYGPQASFFAEMFSTRIRYSGASFTYQMTNIVGGGLAPFIALFMIERFKSWLPIAVYLAVAGVISVVGLVVARETRGRDLDQDELRAPAAAPATHSVDAHEPSLVQAGSLDDAMAPVAPGASAAHRTE